jgi:hypothetical protein
VGDAVGTPYFRQLSDKEADALSAALALLAFGGDTEAPKAAEQGVLAEGRVAFDNAVGRSSLPARSGIAEETTPNPPIAAIQPRLDKW